MSNKPQTWQIYAHREGVTKQGIMEESETQQHALGTLIELQDGRKFRYCKNGAVALAAGKLLQAVILGTERDDAVNAAAAVAIGGTEVVITAVVTVGANDWAEGFLHIVNDTGEGLQYKIKSNTAAAIASDYTVTLYDPIITALAATTDVILSKSPYAGVLLAADDLSLIVGVPTIPVTANYYFWSQTGGVGMVLQNGSTGVATTEREVYADVAGGTDGAALSTAGGAVGKQQVGYHYFDTIDVVSTEYWPVLLTID